MSRLPISIAFLVGCVIGLAAAQPPKESPGEPILGGKSLSDWVGLLGSADAGERRRAMTALRALGGDPDALAERLLARAIDPKGPSTEHAVALGELGPAIVPALSRGLWTVDKRTRQVCLLALGRIGTDAHAAVPSVLGLLRDPDTDIRRDALAVLRAINDPRAIPAVKQTLQYRDADARQYAAFALIGLGGDPSDVMPIVVAELKNDDNRRAGLAATLVGELGPEGAAAVPALTALLSRDDPDLTIRVAMALAAIGPAAKDAVPALKKRLAGDKHHGHEIGLDIAIALWRIARDPDAARILREQVANSARSQQAAEALWRIDSGEETIKALADLLKSEKPEIAIAAANVLGAKAKDAVPLLGRLLAHTEPNVRARAVVALVRLGADAKEAQEALRGATKDDNPQIAFWAAVAACRLDPKPEAVNAVAGYLDHRDADLRRSAAEALGDLRAKAAPAAPRMTIARADEDGQVRLAAAMAAWKATSEFAALQSAADLLRSPDPLVRSLAAVDIGAIAGAEAKPVVPELTKRLFDSYSSVRSSTAEALGRIGSAASDAAPALIALLEGDEPSFVQSAACEALGSIQPQDKEAAIAILRKKLGHPDELVRIHAALAVWRLARDESGAMEAERGFEYRTYQVRISTAELMWLMKRDARVVPFVVRTLEDSNLDGRSTENERYMAARLAGRIGPPAKPALPELRKLLNHSDAVLATTAAEAIRAIEAGK